MCVCVCDLSSIPIYPLFNVSLCLYCKVFSILCNFVQGTSVKIVIENAYPHSHHIEIHKLIVFSVIHKLLYRVHEYPVLLNPPHAKHVSFWGHPSIQIDVSMLDGSHCVDEICAVYLLDRDAISDSLQKWKEEGICSIIWKADDEFCVGPMYQYPI